MQRRPRSGDSQTEQVPAYWYWSQNRISQRGQLETALGLSFTRAYPHGFRRVPRTGTSDGYHRRVGRRKTATSTWNNATHAARPVWRVEATRRSDRQRTPLSGLHPLVKGSGHSQVWLSNPLRPHPQVRLSRYHDANIWLCSHLRNVTLRRGDDS